MIKLFEIMRKEIHFKLIKKILDILKCKIGKYFKIVCFL